MHWLCTDVPAIKLALLIPPSGQSGNINLATSTFFTPKSARTLHGRPGIEIAPMNRRRTVAAKLLLLHCNYLIIRINSSIAPCIIIGNPSLLEKLYIIVSMLYAKLWKNWLCKTKFLKIQLKKKKYLSIDLRSRNMKYIYIYIYIYIYRYRYRYRYYIYKKLFWFHSQTKLFLP